LTPLEYLRKKKQVEEQLNEKKNLKENNNLLKIHNNFIESFITKNSIIPFKIVFYISRIHNYENNIKISEDNTNKLNTYHIDTKELCKYCNIDKSTLISNIKKLQETTITTINSNEELEYTTLIPRSKFIWGKNKLEIDLYKSIVQLIIEVEKKYTTIDFTNIMRIHSKHSFKILQLLEQIKNYSKTSEKVYKHSNGKETTRIELPKRKFFSIEELQLLLNVSYKSCSEFERRILEPSKEDLDLNSKYSFIYDSVFDNQGKGRPKSKGFYISVVDNKNRQGVLF
jgi:hypothetical protein